jgi:hypothetical protein
MSEAGKDTMPHISRLMFICVLLAGCDMISHDRTHASGMDAVVGKSFVLLQDSFLIENYCDDGFTTKRCLFLQVSGGSIQRFSGLLGHQELAALPTSIEDYEHNPALYNEQLADRGLLRRESHDIVATVPKGTLVTVTTTIDSARGDEGRSWLVYAAMGSQPGMAIQLGPAQLSFKGQPYLFTLQGRDTQLPPNPNTIYLQPVSP